MIRFTALVIGLGTMIASGEAGVFAQPNGTVEPSHMRLAQHLKAIGGRFYGSWTCPACQRQLALFNLTDKNAIPYIECNKPEAYPDQAKICQSAELRVYPTWELRDGSRLEGVQSLETLQRWSGLK